MSQTSEYVGGPQNSEKSPLKFWGFRSEWVSSERGLSSSVCVFKCKNNCIPQENLSSSLFSLYSFHTASQKINTRRREKIDR